MKTFLVLISLTLIFIPSLIFSQVSVHISEDCEVIANEVDISVSGDWINDGTFTSQSSNLNFTGDDDQVLTPPDDNVMANLNVNKTNGELFLSDTLYIVDSLNLNSGNLVTHDTSIVILMQEAEVHGGDTSSFIDGPMAKVYAVTASPDTFVFPTGDSLDYRPVTVQFASVTGDTIIIKVEQVNQAAESVTSTFDQLSAVSPLRYWNIEKTGPGSFADARVTLSYDTVATNDSAFVASDLRMAQLNTSSTWVNIGGTGTADSTGSIQGDAFSDFLGGQFTLGEAALVLADITSLMEGPYSSGTMNTYLQQNALLPLSQPYNGSPWNYAGSESVVSVPENVVDWVLVELRTGTDATTMVSQRACFVLNEGSIVDTDGVSPLRFEDVMDGSFYVVIYHRNHLAIMTATAVSLSSSDATAYDFTADITSAYTTGPAPMSEVATDVYAMVSGDGNSDNGVDAIDHNTIWIPDNGTPWDYNKLGDYNLDGGIDAIDYNLFWVTNNGRGSQVPLSGGTIIAKRKTRENNDITKISQKQTIKKKVKKTTKSKTNHKGVEVLKVQKKKNNKTLQY